MYESLKYRQRIVNGLKKGYVAEAGLIAHGRGEAFDYLIGEKTLKEAKEAEKAAVALLLLSKNSLISVNGNLAALIPEETVRLARLLNSKIEINLFYRTLKRERLIKKILMENGAKKILGIGRGACKKIPGLDSKRGLVDPRGIWISDTVLVPLEDGDRTKSLVKMKKNVISIDLNPLSRTSESATISIVDNIVRAVPNMIKLVEKMKYFDENKLRAIVKDFDNKRNLRKIVGRMRKGI